MTFNELFKVVATIMVLCLFAVGAIVISDWIIADADTNDSAITTNNDGDEIAGRYHRRSSTARFFNRG